MCGIAGVLGPAMDPDRASAMIANMRYRGPDALGTLALPGAVLGLLSFVASALMLLITCPLVGAVLEL